MSVVGIDVGTQSILIAQAGKGGVDLILNESSNRQTPTFVAVQGKQRFYGDAALSMVSYVISMVCFIFYISHVHDC